MIAKFYEGTYVFRRGMPSALVLGMLTKSGDYVGEAFVVIEKNPRAFDVVYHRDYYRQNSASFEKLKVASPESFIAANALRAVESVILGMQIEEYEKIKADVAMKPVVFKEVQNWELEVLRWRLRGLPETELDKMAQEVASDDVAAVFKKTRHQDPIIVRDVISGKPA